LNVWWASSSSIWWTLKLRIDIIVGNQKSDIVYVSGSTMVI